jgi:hypothetical protein
MSFFWYSGSNFVPIKQRHCEPMVIDSFLVDNGQVRGFDLHLKRFASQVPRVLPASFPSMLAMVLPEAGQWFPRLEYHIASQEIYVHLRPAPQLRTITRLETQGAVDSREKPQVKGWDLPLLTKMRAAAETRGYDDVILLDAEGHPKETTTAVMAFLVDNTLHTPDPSLGILPSVTWELTQNALHHHGLQVAYGVYDWVDFHSAASVVGNALHGWTDVIWGSEKPSGTAAWLNSLIPATSLVRSHSF